ncbi:hypothetical protein [Photobacterium sanguinicancri]|uniref:Uncharacterized protein n=1 Tax=Photobacterium sanguinicancri TaxID=875932 RepID=A0ABX4FSL6_9GAMM|nr:hypothetical protein [Photobacterium sanguinicancri]OZS41807.1 hypothetical protein ASV53_21730 [Photobacterium sanguinicancri]
MYAPFKIKDAVHYAIACGSSFIFGPKKDAVFYFDIQCTYDQKMGYCSALTEKNIKRSTVDLVVSGGKEW